MDLQELKNYEVLLQTLSTLKIDFSYFIYLFKENLPQSSYDSASRDTLRNDINDLLEVLDIE